MPGRVGERERLQALCEGLGEDEVAVLCAVAEGLARGRHVYGELHVAHDQRDWHTEAGEELRDALVYAAAGLIALQWRV